MQGTLKISTLAGIEIHVHYTWLFAFVLLAWSLAQGYFPTTDTGLGRGTYWVLGVVSALLLFGSVLVHELGHSLVAGARGLRVQSITLFIFGGVSSITSEASRAGDECRSPACRAADLPARARPSASYRDCYRSRSVSVSSSRSSKAL